MEKNKNKIEIIIPIAALIISFIGIYITTYKDNVEIKSLSLIIGIAGSCLGLLLSILFFRLIRRKPITTVFLAYSYNDKEFAEKIYKSLNDSHIKTLMEENETEIGIDIVNQLRTIISNADIVIVILSKDFHKSKNLKNIISLSKQMHKKILPISIDNSQMPNSVSNLRYVDTTENFDKAAKQVVNEVLHSN
ncbi:toll/interleukin-1 receptor domain-containing protein [Pseudomonas shirazensis]